MTRPATAAGSTSDWMSLGPASAFVGVDPDTLRRWADDGRVRAFATPGGHRRFSRTDLERLATSRRPARGRLADLGATPDRLVRAYARSYRTAGSPASGPLADDDRDAFRQDGRRLVEALLGYLDARGSDARDRWQAEAVELVRMTARRLAATGSSIETAVATFVAARRPFLAELASLGRRRALDGAGVAVLYDEATALLDRLLLDFVAAFTREG
jgi:excisionase family DNA binding protein